MSKKKHVRKKLQQDVEYRKVVMDRLVEKAKQYGVVENPETLRNLNSSGKPTGQHFKVVRAMRCVFNGHIEHTSYLKLKGFKLVTPEVEREAA